MAASDPLLSIVVAAAGAERHLAACLAALNEATTGMPAEILVMDTPEHALVPVLWQQGLDESRGTFVAFLTPHSIVDRTWAQAMTKALSQANIAGAGGSFRLAPSAGALVSAVFFLRFSKHIEDTWTAGPYAGDIAADNAAYRRADLVEAGLESGAGFWEVEAHRGLRRRGRTFVAAAGASVTVVGAPPFLRLLRERFRHGRRFGAWRSAVDVSRTRVIAASPLVPFVLAARIARRVWPLRKYRRQLLAATPWLLAFSAAWAAGEAAGAMRPTDAGH